MWSLALQGETQRSFVLFSSFSHATLERFHDEFSKSQVINRLVREGQAADGSGGDVHHGPNHPDSES